MENVLNNNNNTYPVVFVLQKKKRKKEKKERKCKCNFFGFCFCLQISILEQKEQQLNFILPRCLFPKKCEISRIFAIDKQNFLANKRYVAVFSKVSLKPIYISAQKLIDLYKHE